MNRILVVTALGLAIAVSVCACAPARPAAPPPAPTGPAGAPSAKPDTPAAPSPQAASVPGAQTIRGELVDLACYLDHGAKGEHHKACATSCALKGLPIGILDRDNKVTIVIGEHDRPMNTELAEKMGTTVQLTGKIVSRDGMQMIEVSGVE